MIYCVEPLRADGFWRWDDNANKRILQQVWMDRVKLVETTISFRFDTSLYKLTLTSLHYKEVQSLYESMHPWLLKLGYTTYFNFSGLTDQFKQEMISELHSKDYMKHNLPFETDLFYSIVKYMLTLNYIPETKSYTALDLSRKCLLCSDEVIVQTFKTFEK